jgi:hypothetical protein
MRKIRKFYINEEVWLLKGNEFIREKERNFTAKGVLMQ